LWGQLPICVDQRIEIRGVVCGGPSGQIARAAGEIELRELAIVERERGRPVDQAQREVAAHPIEDGHEVVAHDADADRADAGAACAPSVDETLSRWTSELDVFVNGNAFNDGERDASRFSLLGEALERRAGPHIADGRVVNGAHDTDDARDL